ncbi:MAG: cytochrome c biogenesis protein CcdA [Saprospiraceae bacterium]
MTLTTKAFSFTAFCIFLTVSLSAQIYNPVKWSTELKKTGTDQYDLIWKAKIDEGWSVYTQYLPNDDGPVRTSLNYDKSDGYTLVGKATEAGGKKEGFDPIWEMNVVKFYHEFIITQKIKVSKGAPVIKGYLNFMVCDATKCLPPSDFDFSFAIPAGLGANDNLKKNETEVAAVDSAAQTPIVSAGTDSAAVADITSNAVPLGKASLYPIPVVDLNQPVGACETAGEAAVEGKGIFAIFILGFLGGLVALLTPCVFPMIPLTVSFFTKRSKDSKKGKVNAFLYGFFILAVYLLISIPFHLLDSVNPDILNDISTNVALNVTFFVVFMFFAFSFFGYYELTLPSRFTNKVANAEGVGGILGIFFMALTLALVSFSCTGPILGTLLAGAMSSDGGAWQLTAGMGGFGLALAFPFALFAMFPGWMKSLPKSGGWLTTVKVVLGFLELALAFKFLSNADLVKHWGLLKIEPFLALWILIFIGLTLYLFGKIKFPHDDPIKKLSITRKILGTFSLAFALYLGSGFIFNKDTNTWTSLTLLSGMAPPVGYSIFHPKECPQNLDCFKDLDEGIAFAKKVKKPIMIDFTGHACVNCRKMEEHVWPEKEVYSKIKNDYVLISLYVDEKIELPADQQVEVDIKSGGKRTLRTVGNKWSHFQTEYFNNNSQPYYVLLSPDGKLLNHPIGYTPESGDYASFLECGIENYKELKSGKNEIGMQ